MITRRMPIGGVAAGLLLVAAVTACGPAPQGSSSSGSPVAETFTVAMPSATVDTAHILLAQAGGFFAKEGLSVEILAGPVQSTVSYVTSGRADLASYTPVAAVQAAGQGAKVKVIYGPVGAYGIALVGSPKIKSISDAQALTSCSLAAPGPGSAIYSYAVQFIANLSLKCNLTNVPSLDLIASGVQSGQYDLGAMTFLFAPGVLRGGGNLLLDPRTPAYKSQYIPAQWPQQAIFGLADHLAARKGAVHKFLRAVTATEHAIATEPADKLIKDLLKLPSFSGANEADQLAYFELLKPSFNLSFGNGPVGYIDSVSWSTMLKSAATYGIQGFSPTDASAQYSSLVDMSYLIDSVK